MAGDLGGTTEMIKPDPAPAPASPEPVRLERVETVQNPPPPAAPAASSPAPGNKLPSVETMKDMYNAIRQGAITDPVVIMDVARQFENLANDPVASKTIDFDAARAANTLRQRAQKMQELAQMRAAAKKQEG